jgi:hypothetical protein
LATVEIDARTGGPVERVDRFRRVLRGPHGWRRRNDESVDVEVDQLAGRGGKASDIALAIAPDEENIAPLDIPKLAQPLQQRVAQRLNRCGVGEDTNTYNAFLRLRSNPNEATSPAVRNIRRSIAELPVNE